MCIKKSNTGPNYITGDTGPNYTTGDTGPNYITEDIGLNYITGDKTEKFFVLKAISFVIDSQFWLLFSKYTSP